MTPLGILAARSQELAAERRRRPASCSERRTLADGLDPYVEACTTPESPDALTTLADRTRAHPWEGALEQEMLSGHVEGQAAALPRADRRARGGCSRSGCSRATPRWRWPRRCPTTASSSPARSTRRSARFARECFAASAAGRRIDVRVGPAAATAGAAAGRCVRPGLRRRRQGRLPELRRHRARARAAGAGRAHRVDNTLMQGQPWTGEPTRQRGGDRCLQRGRRRRPARRAGAAAGARRPDADPTRRDGPAEDARRAGAADGGAAAQPRADRASRCCASLVVRPRRAVARPTRRRS